jgi:phenylacetate-coenzyme A ligase PaaK-like adenylate-forming protein
LSNHTQLQRDVLEELPHGIERLQMSGADLRTRQRDGLRTLLAYARERSPFHRRRLGALDVEGIELEDIVRLPVMTKAEMMDELDDVYTDGRLNVAAVEHSLATTRQAPVPILDEYFALTSGGSSGRRGVFVLDRHAAVAFLASLTRSLLARLNVQGGPPTGGLRIAMVGAPSAVHATGAAEALSNGNEMPFHFLSVPATLPLADIVERLNELDAPGLAGYPTILARLAEERRVGRLRIAPKMISSTSETLNPPLREAITGGFGAPIVDMFGSTEGLVGISAPDDQVLVFNNDVCITELVDEDNQPVPPGTPSAKVLVTNLSNRAQPLIRYEMTDSFIRQPDSPEHGHLRATVSGRSDEVLRWEGIEIHPIVVRSVLVKSPDVIDYQVRQTDRGIDVSAVGTATLDVESLRDCLTDALGNAGLATARVTLRTVGTLQRHHETGKVQRFVPLS